MVSIEDLIYVLVPIIIIFLAFRMLEPKINKKKHFEKISLSSCANSTEVIKAKVCPNQMCKLIIPEHWSASYNNNFCPKCGYGYDKEKVQKWETKRTSNEQDLS
ncbi:hypothetical protein MOF28_15440 [Bacillus haynesii]|uniref:hypothetical protein n=1 Tax=Bacillus haynesii TaxID=1925021 RepID=UPI00228070AA|nr:hypothetical protein [Bacillus haynesii]MCY9339748.1 hypothetical protein [Bacillus haynesii]